MCQLNLYIFLAHLYTYNSDKQKVTVGADGTYFADVGIYILQIYTWRHVTHNFTRIAKIMAILLLNKS